MQLISTCVLHEYMIFFGGGRHQRQEIKCLKEMVNETDKGGSGWVAQLCRVSSQYAKVVGLIPSLGTYKN